MWWRMNKLLRIFGLLALLAARAGGAVAADTLDIYFIDVEGGQSTLIVTPAGQSLLVDTGYAGNGGRDAQRILAAARDAGVQRIDFLWTTHFHADHDGGIVDLTSKIPIGTFVDHGGLTPKSESAAETLKAFQAYAAIRARGQHMQVNPGEHLALKGADVTVVSAAGKGLTKALTGARGRNAACAPAAIPAQDPDENIRSNGFVLQFGKFRFLDVGDLTGDPLFSLVCPSDLIGPVSVYLVPHHGGADAADPATFAALQPRVAVINNGATKGGEAEIFSLLRSLPQIDLWQLHRSDNKGVENTDAARIANLDETTGHWLKLRAGADGSFEITNGRTGDHRRYP